MKKFGLLSTSAISSAALFGLSLAFAAPAYAQDTTTVADDQCTAEEQAAGTCTADTQAASSDGILVTGSRIRRPNLESNVPIVSVTAEDLTSQGDVNVGDALNDLPSLRSTFSQANSNRFIGTTGINLLDLRGLGISRTLVLVNGRRHITAQVGDFLVDVNTIPSDLIERVDVITGGSSAVYGSDAVAGVVNFVLRRDFDGIRLRGQGGVSQQGDRGIQFVSLTAGRNFWDDRANIAINLEYANAEALYRSDRPELTGAFDGRCQLQLSDVTTGEAQSGDGVPDQLFLCGVRNVGISNGGTVTAASPVVRYRDLNGDGVNDNETLACTNALLASGAMFAALGTQRCLSPGSAQGQVRIFRFNSAGQLIQDIPTLDFRPFASGNYIANPAQDPSAVGSTLNDTGQLAPGLDRYSANLIAHFDISDAFRPFVEAKYVRLFARQEGQPSFFQSVANTIGAPNPRCDNAFLTAANRAELQARGYCNVDPAIGAASGFNPAGTVPIGRFNVDFGGRSELVTRETYRIVAGAQGDFNDDWNYEVSFNYGRVDLHQDELNNLVLTDTAGNFDGFLLAYDAVFNGAGQVVCRVNQVTVTRPDCVPINIFGGGRPSQAALDFVNTTSTVDARATEYDALAYVNGDLSQLFEFPGGPVRFVLGAEYRRESAYQEADALSAASATFFNAFQVFDPPAFEVLEAFGEIELPLLRDLPFAHELTLTAAARYSDYNTSAGTTFSYNLSGTWAPVRDVRFRANYSKSVRVPTLSDLYFPATQNFNSVQDPCDVQFIGNGTTNRAANCLALGVPVGFINTVARAQTIEIISSGNELLTEETGKSLTIGTVITPRWIPGFSLTIDYYRIRVNNLIAVLSAQTILNQCVDLPTITNQYCELIFPRQPGGLLQSPALISAGVNFAQFAADGIDIEASYRRTFDNGHRLNIRGIATYVIKRTNFTSPTDPDFADRILGELGDPQWAANLNITYGMGPFDIRYSMNYIGKQYIGAYENYFSVQGRPPQNADNAFPIRYPDVLYHAARLSYRVNERFQFYGGVDNIFDTAPPLGLTGTAAGDPFDAIGRYFYAGATVDF
jgi:outer membrane receptor protein involved in Fe transport